MPVPDRNGIITGYNVQYKKKVGDLEWKNVTVGAVNMSLHVRNLDFYTIYQFKVAALNDIGSGPYSNITEIRTDADGTLLDLFSVLLSTICCRIGLKEVH